jgi:hypothetical protein
MGGGSGSILGIFPPPISQGTSHENPISQPSCFARDDSVSSLPRSAPYPKLEFPKFSGENPRWWRDQCEMYFEVYAVHPALKTRFATLNFTGPATTWLQTVERRGRIGNWEKLCELVFAKFDKDQYPVLLKQFDALKQVGSVMEYQRRFEELAHGILLYNPAYDDTYLVTRFLRGLKEEIRVAITLHRPKDVDTTSTLAQLQEEELESSKKKFSPKETSKHAFKPYIVGDKARQAEPDKVKAKLADDKLSSLKTYR